ncbi:MAG: T9SS type A sorting domain-containing protein [Flavobacteriales bacterium]|nr:T9SS type A sorting domain-containing protein [Flavobacteriales bacterium]
MRVAILLTILTSSSLLHAQEWQLVRPGWKYNYQLPGAEAISDQVFITSTETIGSDTVRYQFNRIAVFCDTCAIHLRTNVPQFLQGSVTSSENIWHFQEPNSIVVLPMAELGAAWLMDTAANIIAEVTAVDTLMFFGLEDVHKTISCSNGDLWVISREWGVVRMNERELVGIHGPDIGLLVPTLAQMYPYQVGDVVEYRKFGLSGNLGSLTFRTYQSKYNILDRTDEDSSIAFSTWRVEWRTVTLQQGSSGSHSTQYGEEMEFLYQTTPIELPYKDLLFSYPGELITTQHDLGDSPHFECIAQHGIDDDGRYILECDLLAEFGIGSVKYSEGIGLVNYEYGTGYSEYYWWLGSVINGDTLGTINSDDYLLDVEEFGQGNITAYPNPTRDVLILEGLEPGNGTYVLRDALGRIVLEEALNSPTATLDVSRLPEGVYFLSDRVGSRSVPVKVVIAR